MLAEIIIGVVIGLITIPMVTKYFNRKLIKNYDESKDKSRKPGEDGSFGESGTSEGEFCTGDFGRITEAEPDFTGLTQLTARELLQTTASVQSGEDEPVDSSIGGEAEPNNGKVSKFSRLLKKLSIRK